MLKISPAAQFCELDAIEALIATSKEPLGRPLLQKKLLLSEASTRSLMELLASQGLARATTRGMEPTPKGKSLAKRVSSLFDGPRPVKTSLPNSFAILARGSASKIKGFGLAQRDAAVRGMCDGLMVFVYRGKKLTAPGVEASQDDYKSIASEIKDSFDLRENDVVLVAFSSSKKNSRSGAWLAAKTLIPKAL